MTKANGAEQLADWKFQYDLLTNELFHLHEFTSLLEFDPAFRHESDSFARFLADKHLELRMEEDAGAPGLEESSAMRRIRRRQKRGRGEEEGNALLKGVEELVEQKYADLRARLDRPMLKQGPRKRKQPGDAAKTALPHDSKKRKSAVVRKETNDEEHLKEEKSASPTVWSPESPQRDTYRTIHPSGDHEGYQSSSSDSFYFTTSSEDEEPTVKRSLKRKKAPVRRIKLIVHPPKQTVTNPLHILKPECSSLHEFLQSYKSLDEDISIEEFDSYIASQRKVVSAIRKGLKSGVLTYDRHTDSIQGISLKDVQNSQANKPEPITTFYQEQEKHTLRDHLNNHGVVMSRMFQDRKRGRIARARKISQMIEQHFKHVAGAEERKTKEEEKRRRALARAAVQAVKKRWNLAERAYKVLKKDEEDQLKRIQGKEHLSKMLEQSTQLLGAQLNQNDDSDDETSSQVLSENESSLGDEEMSSSSELDDSEVEAGEDDSKLTVEQLRAKYSALEHITIDGRSQNSEVSSMTENPEEDPQEYKILLSEREKAELHRTFETEENNILDEDHSSSSSFSESEISQTSSSENESLINSNSSQTPGLASLFGNVAEELSDDAHYSTEESLSSTPNEDQEGVQPNADAVSNMEIDSLEMQDKDESTNLEKLSVVDVPVPPLLRGTLRTYQKQGLNWLASLYNNNTNGILADEMGLGKTIQTIALLAYLACEKENWGPHLIIVPTSVLLNWEMEFKRFAPGFKVLSYYGSPQQRKEKRRGWNKLDAFHVCITSYQLVVHDQHSFKRKKWQYMILDEAHNIKNFKSTRWQALLNFNTRRRLLLTGTPLQNNIAELWSLLYFLMPQTALENGKISGFADLDAFQQWFGKPVDKIIAANDSEHDDETRRTVSKLHQVLRPYLLRRLKADVEKQMPAKYEHILYCRLSKRQRFLYDDFMSRAQTKATLASGNFMSIINCLMQLRKVCNHPDLFEVRPILTSFCMDRSVMSNYAHLNQLVLKNLNKHALDTVVNLQCTNLAFTQNDFNMETHYADSCARLQCVRQFSEAVEKLRKDASLPDAKDDPNVLNYQDMHEFYTGYTVRKRLRLIDQYRHTFYLNSLRCEKRPVYGINLVRLVSVHHRPPLECNVMSELMKPLETRLVTHKRIIDEFAIITPTAITLDTRVLSLGLDSEAAVHPVIKSDINTQLSRMKNPFHLLQTKLSIAFPDKSLLQYDCGKLQSLAVLLRRLKEEGHRALIFTQMTKVLDILEQFLNYHGYLYMRLDGATKIEDRQILTERFNTDPRITVFILSSRSGGLGINLTGADTVIFYDSDWNPAMDKQCQDRCHRIGQTRDVHIYRFVSEHTIESNILKKANQKRQLDNIVIQKGEFTTDYFSRLSVKDLLGSDETEEIADERPLLEDPATTADSKKLERLLAQAEDEDDVKAARLAMKEVDVDDRDFRESSTCANPSPDEDVDEEPVEDEYEGTRHVEEYMIRFIANGYLYD
ncbi:ADR309Wp [Eremothecium gossypii ATCC 10895]|uniref:Chromatin remodeling protein SWR1 n=1 Tax=Eremothecium gossypii (strain ATCC 10895 / CBS 109.51 / FGSC 9923 / NRRL Y-1056) TaxID=284811 RepID=SWR1_EREGS|nr:ADR309Wp [Eremothecium gossypii ATCC 10895]Q759G7.2 RecName: Full=Helicase SWR1 [Eremothecium gossypii ATCC 10895]AAS52229.2 ADR309Wp [Eremothecium gossypii ATCC 10895]